MSTPSIVPKPQSLTYGEGTFVITNTTPIVASGDAQPIAGMLVAFLRPATGYDLPIQSSEAGGISLALREGDSSEGYELTVAESGINIVSSSPAGLFYGIQTLRQLLPDAVESETVQHEVEWAIPAVTIQDTPRFGWRGIHLDVGRHYFDVAFIKKMIDLMTLYKYNTFHWHLTEDQGWRIEIKQYPKLTEIGSQRTESQVLADPSQGDGTPYGGFYTQDEIREVVAYAADRHITVIPEIEMPGHAVAALTSYPELGCVGEGYSVRTTWGISDDVFCAGKEEVFTFLENVLTEVLDLFPSEYIHIGGDECPKVRWEQCPDCQARIQAEGLANEYELQSYFIRRMEKWLNERRRRLVGWDEILEGGLAPHATVMAWRDIQYGIEAANAGHDVVMSPITNCYLDYYQSLDLEKEPQAIEVPRMFRDRIPPEILNRIPMEIVYPPGESNPEHARYVLYLPLERAYEFEPIPPEIDVDKAHHVLGGQGNIWTEYMPTTQQVEYMTFPRAIALAEILWSYPQERDFEEFRSRLEVQLERLDKLNVNYRKLDD